MPRSLPSLAALRVLVIDDQQDAREALAALLGGMQAQVRVFASGEQALAFIRKQGVLRCAEVLLCDIAMPGEDGYAVLSRLRTLEKDLGLSSEQRLPAIALTAFAQREERQRAIEAGFALHLSKPVSAEDLAAAVLRVARRAP